jgi:CubicO group peptidase (beta-lactamase class C family)
MSGQPGLDGEPALDSEPALDGEPVQHGDPGLRAACTLVDDAVAEGLVPGAVLAAGLRGETSLLYSAGHAQRDDQARRPMTAATIFDLASLTKVVGTTSCVLRLVAAGRAELDDRVCRYLPAFRGAGKDEVTLRQLLTHTSGLPDQHRYYEVLTDRAETRAAALAEPLVAAPGSTCRYSDIGFIVLGELAAAAGGCGLAELVQQLVCEPLGLQHTMFRPPAELAANIASTELVAGVAKTGVVHDENAELLGGIAGHAGLFGTAADLGRFAAAWTSDESAWPDDWLPAWLRAEAVRCQTDGLDGRRGLGWGLRHDRWDNMGDGWPASGAGHTGFTGTSISVDPVSGLWAVLLTNSVHFGRNRPGRSVVGLRKKVHAAVAAALLRPGNR